MILGDLKYFLQKNGIFHFSVTFVIVLSSNVIVRLEKND